MVRPHAKWNALRVALAATTLATGALGDKILRTTGFTECGMDPSVNVNKVSMEFNNDQKLVTFDVSGSSTKEHKVMADLEVFAYGKSVYHNSFNPCSNDTFVDSLCPMPTGDFSANGTQIIPDEYANMIPAIAFQVPDISAQARLQLKSMDDDLIACIDAQVTNGKTASVPAVKYIAAGVAGAALLASGVSAVTGVTTGGAGSASPGFTEVVGWFQGMAMNGMLSVNYPPVYRAFTQNFGFACGIIPWANLQESIDTFRSKTGGNLTLDSFAVLNNATLVYPDNSTSSDSDSLFKAKRAFQDFAALAARAVDASADSDDSDDSGEINITQIKLTVSGISAYVQQLSVPKSNTFMTALLIVAIVLAAVAVGILLVKVVLEFWALFASFPKSLSGFREHYWGSIGRALTSLILLLYGIWVLYCVFQFTQGDSWAAKTLAGVSLALFTAILAFFSWKIWSTARKLKNVEGDTSGLYEKKETWMRYSIFYESYRKDYWWIFVPTIMYMFAKGCALAAGDGHGMPQTIAQLMIEAVMLCLLLWSRPFERKSGNVINIAIQVTRVLSVACILVFVEQFGIEQTTKTVTGVVLIAVQSALTGMLAILIAWNAINACIKENPHRKRRKEMGTLNCHGLIDSITDKRYREDAARHGRFDPSRCSQLPAPGPKGRPRQLHVCRFQHAEGKGRFPIQLSRPVPGSRGGYQAPRPLVVQPSSIPYVDTRRSQRSQAQPHFERCACRLQQSTSSRRLLRRGTQPAALLWLRKWDGISWILMDTDDEILMRRLLSSQDGGCLLRSHVRFFFFLYNFGYGWLRFLAACANRKTKVGVVYGSIYFTTTTIYFTTTPTTTKGDGVVYWESVSLLFVIRLYFNMCKLSMVALATLVE